MEMCKFTGVCSEVELARLSVQIIGGKGRVVAGEDLLAIPVSDRRPKSCHIAYNLAGAAAQAREIIERPRAEVYEIAQIGKVNWVSKKGNRLTAKRAADGKFSIDLLVKCTPGPWPPSSYYLEIFRRCDVEVTRVD